jgi:hypothetical protein
LDIGAATPAVVPPTPPVKEEPIDTSPVEYEKTGDPGLDMALEFVGKAGIGESHPAMKAAREGDFSILKAELAAKNIPGWEQYVALGEAAYAREKAEVAKKAAETRDAVVKAAGGEETWKAVRTWAAANATDAEKTEINAMLNQGGVQAAAAVKYLLGAYERANNVEVTPPDARSDKAGRDSGRSDTKPLSARDYAAEVQRLNVKLGGRLEGSPEYEALQRRRAAAMR